MHLTFLHWRAYCQLIRLDKPVGFFLLLWPCLWSLWLASGTPIISNIVVFTLGAFIMRSAGCIINDYADKDLDCYVKRTCNRPLTSKKITASEALELFILLLSLAFIMVLFMRPIIILLSFPAVILVILYPFMKRITYFPQIILGLAFSYSIPMAWLAEIAKIDISAWWLMIGTFFWIIAYDSYYSMEDRDDDLRVGIKSIATLMGNYTKFFIGICNLMTLIFWGLAGKFLHLNGYFYCFLLVILGLFIYQQYITYKHKHYYVAFLNNNWVGAVMFIGILSGLN